MIRLSFFGAGGEVTGSCYVLTTDRASVMLDMGMHQGEQLADEHNRRMPPIDVAKLDAVVLTHAHLDHSGRLPLLPKNGYQGRIHCTDATADITGIILRDSASLQVEDCERFNRRLGDALQQVRQRRDVEGLSGLRSWDVLDPEGPRERGAASQGKRRSGEMSQKVRGVPA